VPRSNKAGPSSGTLLPSRHLRPARTSSSATSLMQPSAKKVNSTKFVVTEFCEIRNPLATAKKHQR